MAKTVHEIDPDADTIIILKNPLTSFAVWSPDEVEGHAKVPDPNSTTPFWGTNVEEPAIEVTDTGSSCQTVPTPETTVGLGLSENSTDEEEIQYYVSSQHLKLASPKFKSMLSGGKWKEGIPHEADGRYHILVEDWDAEALLLLMNILHHRNRRVPRSLSLEMLAKVVVLIDYYQCTEATELYTERWVDHLKAASPPPLDLCRDLILWLCISWVLKLPHEFTQTTAVAMRRRDREMPTLGLPITGCVGKSSGKFMDWWGTNIPKIGSIKLTCRQSVLSSQNCRIFLANT